MMTDPNWIIQKINEWEVRLEAAESEHDKRRAELEIKTYREWLHKMEAEKHGS